MNVDGSAISLQEDLMATEFSYRLRSAVDSQTDDDISGTWLIFAAIALLAVALVLCVANAGFINPGDLWPEPSLIGPRGDPASVPTESFGGKADVVRPLGIPALLKRVRRDFSPNVQRCRGEASEKVTR
jgi:hypothetical protein